MISVSTPGRICLFGEHQDYLGLPVIPCAISLRIHVAGEHQADRTIRIDLPDIGGSESFSLEQTIPYVKERDYLRSSVNVLMKKGLTFSQGITGHVRGNIPINSGTSSSSALVVGWITLLAQLSDQRLLLEAQTIAEYAYEAEVLEFGEPGGMMDQYSTAIGGVMYLESEPIIRIEPLQTELSTFVLGDSLEPKDTKSILSRVKERVMDGVKQLVKEHPSFSLQTATFDDLERVGKSLAPEQMALLQATLKNRDFTHKARRLLHTDPPDDRAIGQLLTEHHQVLRDVLNISTPKIDRMLDAAMKAGAYGGKINGSGGGGCMFVYAPESPAKVAAAIERAGGKAYIVEAAPGTRNEDVQ